MQTALAPAFRESAFGKEADAILRSCVHCGFCNATCPTYQLLGDELEGPRGRIYLIKQALEGGAVTARTQSHLDRCLSCLACETTCPSGVDYSRLLEHGRALVETKVRRPVRERVLRWVLRNLLPYPRRLHPLLFAARLLRPLLPKNMRSRIPRSSGEADWPITAHARRMLVLDGCVQQAALPGINAAAARVLARLGVSLLSAPRAGCCGAMSHHLGATEEAREFARRNIDAWWPQVEAGAEAIVITASGCAVHVKDYAHLLAGDARYADRAVRIAHIARDLSEVIAREDLGRLRPGAPAKIAFHSPCTLQHGQRLNGVVESILRRLGFNLTSVPDAYLCCGSAGTYSILQGAISQQLLRNKVAALETGSPALVATANIGCLLHLSSRASVPVRHWIELVDSGMAEKEQAA